MYIQHVMLHRTWTFLTMSDGDTSATHAQTHHPFGKQWNQVILHTLTLDDTQITTACTMYWLLHGVYKVCVKCAPVNERKKANKILIRFRKCSCLRDQLTWVKSSSSFRFLFYNMFWHLSTQNYSCTAIIHSYYIILQSRVQILKEKRSQEGFLFLFFFF